MDGRESFVASILNGFISSSKAWRFGNLEIPCLDVNNGRRYHLIAKSTFATEGHKMTD